MPSFTVTGTVPFSGSKATILAANTPQITGPSALVDPTQGAIAMRWRWRWAGALAEPAHRFFSRRDGSTNGLELYYESGRIIFAAENAGAVVDVWTNYSGAAETDHTLVAYWSATSISLWVDGTLAASGSRGGVPAIGGTTFDIGRFAPSAVHYAEGDCYWAVLLSSIVTGADAATFHSFGNTDPTWSSIPGVPVALWTADSATYLDTNPGSVETLADASGNGNTLTLNGTVPQTGGLFTGSDGARNFSTPNTANYLTAVDSTSLDVADVFTIEAWIKAASFPAAAEERVILSKGTGAYQLALLPDGRLAARKQGTGTFVISTPITLNVPYLVGVTKSGNDARIYLNGVDSTSVVTSGITCVDNTSLLYIGRNDTATSPFHGVIDDVALYGTALSSARMLAHFRAAGGAAPPPDSSLGPAGTMLYSWSSEDEPLGSPAPIGALKPPWDARRDTVTEGQFATDGHAEYGTWSIVSKNGMRLLQADLPNTTTRPNHRCDLVKVATTTLNPGLEHWYAIEFMVPTGWVAPNTTWGLLIAQWVELGSAKIAPICEIDIFQDFANFALQVGSTTSVEAQFSPKFKIVPVGALSLDPTVHRIIIRMNFQINNTGRFQAWWRRKGETAWTQTVDWTGPTMMYSATTGLYTKELRDEIDAYSAAGPALRFWHHKYGRATGPGVLEDFLNSSP